MKRILTVLCAVTLGALGGVTLGSAPAQAVGCSTLAATYTHPKVTGRANCSVGWRARAWVKYYTSDNTNAQLITLNTPWIYSGTESATHPSTGIYHSKGIGESQS
jgi:hypothetical protein